MKGSYNSHWGTLDISKFLASTVFANSVDPDQTALNRAVWSGCTYFDHYIIIAQSAFYRFQNNYSETILT